MATTSGSRPPLRSRNSLRVIGRVSWEPHEGHGVAGVAMSALSHWPKRLSAGPVASSDSVLPGKAELLADRFAERGRDLAVPRHRRLPTVANDHAARLLKFLE